MKKLLFMLTVLATLFSLISCVDGAINLQKLDFYPAGNNSYVVSAGDAKYLDEIVIPKTYFGMPVVEIEKNGFKGCSRLESITIPNGVTTIGSMAFDRCISLKNVVIPNSVTSIGSYAFYGCTSLESIVIPNSVTRIEGSVFENCNSLESVVIPDSVTSIGANAFYCYELRSIKYRGTEEQWNSIDKHDRWIYSHYKYTVTYNYDGE